MAQLIDGKATAAAVQVEIKEEVAEMVKNGVGAPGLAVILVGERHDSQTYVRNKRKTCAELGIASFSYDLPATASQDEVIALIHQLNENPEVHGILVQLPLPAHMNQQVVLDEIDVRKDVDGLHPHNIGVLAMNRKNAFTPCTPRGVIELLDRYNIPIQGKRCCVVGRSNIVGLPMTLLLLHRHGTVTTIHSRTPPEVFNEVLRNADIVVVAIGKARLIKKEVIKPGAVVIDVGMNSIDDATRKTGYRLVGDVDFDEVKEVAGHITPVPGGVGPMTIAMLMKNTLDAKKKIDGLIN